MQMFQSVTHIHGELQVIDSILLHLDFLPKLQYVKSIRLERNPNLVRAVLPSLQCSPEVITKANHRLCKGLLVNLDNAAGCGSPMYMATFQKRLVLGDPEASAPALAEALGLSQEQVSFLQVERKQQQELVLLVDEPPTDIGHRLDTLDPFVTGPGTATAFRNRRYSVYFPSPGGYSVAPRLEGKTHCVMFSFLSTSRLCQQQLRSLQLAIWLGALACFGNYASSRRQLRD